ncbi:MAG: Flp pilus assembly complex ATPase component TadA [Verrucomicrobia bacterium]|nr:Flp pilus assembly complex ATPase component TadA [Verrucomicrobiota bacterium]
MEPIPTPDASDLPASDGAPRLLEEIVREAARARASDIHLQLAADGAQVSFRLDGVLTPVRTLPAAVAPLVAGRIKYLARLKTYDDSFPQDGRIGKAELGARNDLRVATYPTVTGEKIVLRLFIGAGAHSLDELAFPVEARAALEKFLAQRTGLLLLTGPAGSGKTTTIYACLRHLAESGGRHIITIEDPVEQIVPGLMQTEVNEPRGLTFAKAARHLLRQDPEVLVIGEIRDEETARIALRAAQTGHLVVTTLHAGSCQGVIERLLALAGDADALASAVELVLNQRLLRRTCAACRGAGCAECFSTGYHGRVPAVEWFQAGDDLRRQLRRHEPPVCRPARTLAESARELVAAGHTNAAESQRIIGA